MRLAKKENCNATELQSYFVMRIARRANIRLISNLCLYPRALDYGSNVSSNEKKRERERVCHHRVELL